nr:hypothetical protein [Tanacetum cinerariifolium]
MLVPQGEGSATLNEPHHTPYLEAQPPSHTTHSSPTIPSVTTAPIPPVTSSDTPHIRQYTRRTRIAQSSVLPPIADEPASPLRDISQREACPIDFGFIADQDRATNAKPTAAEVPISSDVFPTASLVFTTATVVTPYRRRKGKEVMVESETPKKQKVQEQIDAQVARELEEKLEREDQRMPEQIARDEAAAKRVSDDTKEMATSLTSMDAATFLESRVAGVPTGIGSIPTAAEVPIGSDMFPTASLVFTTATVVTPYKRRKGKEVMVEYETPKKQKVQEQIDAQVARELEEKLERVDQRMPEQIARDAEIA